MKNLPNKINVYLRDGTSHLGKIMPPRPFGEYERAVGFINQDETLTMIPLDLVAKVVMYYEAE